MRKHKYRAWDKEENDFINKGNPFSFGDLSGKTHGFMFTDPTRRDQEDWFSKTVEIQLAAQGEKSRYILMQYTGLKDKNGKEIYEGDIVKSKAGVSEVEYGSASCAWSVPDIDGSYHLWDFLKKYKAEVIGNIYETPIDSE